MKITKDMSLGEIMDKIPGAVAVIERYFESGCAHCPGRKMETLEMAAMLYGHDVNKIMTDLEALSKE